MYEPFSRRTLLFVLVLSGAFSGCIAPGNPETTVVDRTTQSVQPTSSAQAPLVRSAEPPLESSATDPRADGGRRATVTRVIDGDTVEVRFSDGSTDTVRLLGVDTPETDLGRVTPGEYEGVPETAAGREWLLDWGQRAASVLTERLGGETVRVRTDPEADRRGSYDRLLAYLSLDGSDVAQALLRSGYARLYESSFSKRAAFATVEADAQRNATGLWGFDGSSRAVSTRASGGLGATIATPADGDYDCEDFERQAGAQRVLDTRSGDPFGLDGDDDGLACESLS